MIAFFPPKVRFVDSSGFTMTDSVDNESYSDAAVDVGEASYVVKGQWTWAIDADALIVTVIGPLFSDPTLKNGLEWFLGHLSPLQRQKYISPSDQTNCHDHIDSYSI